MSLFRVFREIIIFFEKKNIDFPKNREFSDFEKHFKNSVTLAIPEFKQTSVNESRL